MVGGGGGGLVGEWLGRSKGPVTNYRKRGGGLQNGRGKGK